MPASERLPDGLHVTQAIILAGGQGTRLRALAGDLPKLLVPVAGRPFVEWLLLALRQQGVKRVVLATGHRGAALEGHLGDGRALGITVVCCREDRPLGTAGALRHALSQIRADVRPESGDDRGADPVLVLNGDSMCRLDLGHLLREHQRRGATATVLVTPVTDGRACGQVEIDQEGWVRGFREKPLGAGPALVNAGVYLFERRFLEQLPVHVELSLERVVLPELAGRRLQAVVVPGPLLDMGTPAGLAAAERQLPGLLAQLGATEPALSDLQAATECDPTAEVQSHFRSSAQLLLATAEVATGSILQAAAAMASCLRSGGKLLICGNGGSASDSQHMAAELISRVSRDFARPPLAALALTADSSVLTALANDEGYERVFARQIEALGRPPDLLVAISTSGASLNVLRAVEAARAGGLGVIVLMGGGEQQGERSPLTRLADVVIAVPSGDTPHIQEAHLAIEHILCRLVERELFGHSKKGPPLT